MSGRPPKRIQCLAHETPHSSAGVLNTRPSIAARRKATSWRQYRKREIARGSPRRCRIAGGEINLRSS